MQSLDSDNSDDDNDDTMMIYAEKKEQRRDAFAKQHAPYVEEILRFFEQETQASANTSDVKMRHANCTRKVYCRDATGTCGKSKAQCRCAETSADKKFHGRKVSRGCVRGVHCGAWRRRVAVAACGGMRAPGLH